jgi:hypothetical protein
MGTAFSASRLTGPYVIGPGLKIATYKMQMGSTSTEAGDAVDLSADFNNVFATIYGTSGAVADFGNVFATIGTYTADGFTASTLKTVSHQSSGGATQVLAVTPSGDLSSVNDLIMIVLGN